MFESPLSASAYEVLGVPPTADDEELRRAFRQRLRQTHPDTGGDAAEFVRVQRAWELIGTAQARAAYDRSHGFSAVPLSEPTMWRPPAARADTRPRARSAGHPGGWRRERYLTLMREWAGRGADLEDPYDPTLLRTAPREIRRLLADALAEEETARIVADLGMGYSVWHDVAVGGPDEPDAKLDHVVLGPSGLYGVLSEDFGGPVGFRRGEIIGPNVPDAPVSDLLRGMRTIARSAGVRFGGAIVVLPDDDVPQRITELGKVRGTRVAVVARSALSMLLRQGIPGVPDIGGNEVFDVRTRLDQRVRFV